MQGWCFSSIFRIFNSAVSQRKQWGGGNITGGPMRRIFSLKNKMGGKYQTLISEFSFPQFCFLKSELVFSEFYGGKSNLLA